MQNLRRISLVFFIVSFVAILNAQDYQALIIESSKAQLQKENEREISFGFEKKQAWNPFLYIFGGAMYVYQKLISPQFSSGCLYEPSCSSFSKQLISEYGLLKGTIVSADRLMRCNKLGGHDIEAHQLDAKSGKVLEDIEIYSRKKK